MEKLELDLAAVPDVVEIHSNSADIVVHTKPSRGYWARDWLVMLGRATEDAFPGAVMLGLDDLVSGKFRPRSRVRL